MDNNDAIKLTAIVRPPLSTIVQPPSSIAPLPQITTNQNAVGKRETAYKSTKSEARKLFDNGISEEVSGTKRKQWNNDGGGSGLFGGRSKEDLLKPRAVSKPIHHYPKPEAVVPQFTSRYSPLLSGGKRSSGDSRRVGFGSSAPRFTDRQPNHHTNQLLESKGPPPIIYNTRHDSSNSLMESNTRKPLPSWLRQRPPG